MKFEVLKKSYLKRNIIIGVVVIAIISAVILNFTRAKYRVTESIPLVNGTINYSLPDLNIIGLYIDGVEATELDSSKTYTLDTTQSTCTYKDGTEISDLSISYDSETGQLQISPFTTKGTKCTLYFEEQVLVRDTILANYPTQLIRDDFSVTLTNTTSGAIYYADTSKGRTYYFAGNPTDNWVYFAGFYWRIIRINEDGTIRMIYQGTASNATGTGTQIGTSAFNLTNNNSMYAGYMYTSGQVHGLGTDSTIKAKLDNWYYDSLRNYTDDIDGDAGFCGDRTSYINNTGTSIGGGTGTIETYYGAYIRLYNGNNTSNALPTFECPDEDLYTIKGSYQGNQALSYPIGLITADEISYAGGVVFENNTSYYLFTNQSYWAISPYMSGNNALVFGITSTGRLVLPAGGDASSVVGVRPVINLKADVQLTGSGISTDPYVVS